MFLDSLATPTRLETLLNLVNGFDDEICTKDDIAFYLQPKGLPDVNPKRQQAYDNISAAKSLEILEEKNNLLQFKNADENIIVKEIIINSFDKYIMTKSDGDRNSIEPWFALFYSYILGRNEKIESKKSADWEVRFNNDLFNGIKQTNPFNSTKLTAYLRWYTYLGLGWNDNNGVFQLNPFDRINRALLKIFKKDKNLHFDDFVQALGNVCPELDGGDIFMDANPGWNRDDRNLSLGVSRALYELHLDKIITLIGIQDQRNFWNFENINPSLDENIKVPQISSIKIGQ